MPGSGKQTPEIQAKIIEFLEAGIDPTTIHRRLKVGRSSIYRMKRCLQQHGTAYAPPETNKKNGRPKVMTPEQEMEIREWLRDPKNRDRYLDDMVWYIHDRFGMVCSTTTCSKIKRKWLKVIEAEERGEHLDPEVAQEQVRQEALRMGKKPTSQRAHSISAEMPNFDELHSFSQHAHDPQLDQSLQDQLQLGQLHGQLQTQLQSQLQSEVASAALRV